MSDTYFDWDNAGSEKSSIEDYTNLSGTELIQNRGFLDDVRNYYEGKGQSFANSSDMLDQWYTDRRWKDTNFGSAGKDLAEYEMAGSNQQLMTRLSKAWNNAPERGSFLGQVWDYGSAAILDPINLIPYAGAASKAATVAKVARAAGATKKAAVGQAVKQGAKRGALIEGGVGAAMGGGMDAIQQSREIQQGLSTEYDYGQIAKSAAIEGVFSSGVGAVVGAVASRKPAQEGLKWSTSKLASEIDIQQSDIARTVQEADAVLADPLRAPDHADATEAKNNAQLETAKINAHIAQVDRLDAEAESMASRLAAEGGETPENRAAFDEKIAAYNEAINSTEIPDVALGTVQADNVAPAINRTTAEVVAEAEAQQAVDNAAEAGDTTGDTGDTDSAEAPVNTEATGDTTATTGDTPVEAAPVEAPAVPEVLEVPKITGVKYAYDVKKDESLQKGLGENLQTHKNKVAKNNEKNGTDLVPLTQDDLNKIVASTPKGTKDGNLAPAGRKAIRRYLAAREGRVVTTRQKAKNTNADAKVDESSFADPEVARIAQEKEAFAKEQEVALEAEVQGLAEIANEKFREIVELAGMSKTRINSVFNGKVKDMDMDTAAAVRRRIEDYKTNVLPVVEKLKAAEKVKALRVEEAAHNKRMYDNDMKYTVSRSADSTRKATQELENNPVAGKTFSKSTNKRTGETIETSKVSSIVKPAQVTFDDGSSLTEGAGMLRRENETMAEAQATAEMDVAQGKNKAVYSFPARAGMQLLGVRGVGRGRRGVATEGQIVYGAMLHTGKGDPIFKVYATENMALERLGLKKSGDIGIDTSKITPAKTNEEYEKIVDKAYNKFEKTGSEAELKEDLAVAKAQGREGGLDVDPAPEVVVKDGKGNVVKTDIPDAPITRNGKVMVLLPRTTEVAPRVASKSQIADVATVSTLLGGKPLSMFRIGYVPAEINGKSAQSQATKRNLIRDNFEPLDEANSFEFVPSVEPEIEMPARPLTLSETDNTVIDMSALASDSEGKDIAQFLFAGDKLANQTMIDDMIAPDFDSFLQSKPTLARLKASLDALERADFVMSQPIGGKDIEIPVGFRIKAIKAFYSTLAKEAPYGVKLDNVDIEASVASLKTVMSGVGEKISGQIEALLRAAVPADNAPKFTIPSDGGSAGSFYTYGPQAPSFNKITLDMNEFDKDGTRTGVSGSFTVMHELAHWAYENIMPYDLKAEFWENVSKYYDETGKFDEGGESVIGGMTKLDTFTPSVEVDGVRVGVSNGKSNPQEYFANQFALYMHHKFESPLATSNKNVLQKAAKVIQKLWQHMTGRHIINPDMEILFDKLITNKDEALRVQFTHDVQPSTSIGRNLQRRFVEVQTSLRDFEEAMEGYPTDHNSEKMAVTARRLSETFNGMSMTKKTQGYLARKAGQDAASRAALEGATGVLKLMSAKQLRQMRTISKAINEATIRTETRVSQTGDDMEVFGSSFHSEMEASLVDIYKSKMKDFSEELMTSMNDTYMGAEYGDIPEMRLSEGQLALRAKYNITGARLAKKKNFEQNIKRETNRQRQSFVRSVKSAMLSSGKANAKAFDGDIVAGTKGSDSNTYNLEEAAREYKRQIGADGVPTAFGKKLARRVRHLVNTQVEDVNLTEEEQAIYHTWQSRNVGKGAKGIANEAKIEDLAFAISITLDGGELKGVAGKPEQIQNIARHLIKQRYEARQTKAAIKNNKVSDAIEIEKLQEVGVGFENGIPQNSNFTMRSFLRGITHRAQEVEYNARTLTARLARLDAILPTGVDDITFKGFRKAVRQAGVNLTRDGDITQSVRLVAESLYGSNVVSQSARSIVSKYAAVMGREPADVFSEIVTEGVDTLSPKTEMKAMHRAMYGEEAEAVENLFADIELDVVDALAYVMNGLINSSSARNRFYGVTYAEDLMSNGSARKGSTRSRYENNVPSEYASDYAHELLDSYSPSARASIDEFTGGKVRVFYANGNSNGTLGRGSYVTARPANTLAKIADDVIASAPEASQADVADYVEALIDLRAKVNSARLDPLSSTEYFDRMYAIDDALSQEIGELGARMDTNVRPVFVRDTTPAIFSGKMNSLSPIVEAMKSHYIAKVAEGLDVRQQANRLKEMTGNFTPSEMLETLTEIAGSERNLREAMIEMGYTSLNVGPEKLVLKKSGVRDVRSQTFENSTPLLGEDDGVSAVNGAMVAKIMTGSDPIKVFEQGAKVLEAAGVSTKSLDGMVSVARGRGMPKDAAIEIRKDNIYNPLRTNSKIMRRSGLKYAADFFEPVEGGGGHFERTNASMGKFLMPMTRMLKELPDSLGTAARYWRTGPVMMAESALGATGFSPKRRNTQPTSHTNIVSALRNSDKAQNLAGKELETYLHIRKYLDAAVSRLRATGNMVGEIKENYFPQVWRKDLIEADPETFKRGVAKYFMVSNASMQGSKPMTQDEAMTRANRLVDKLLDDDGVLSSPSSNLKSAAGGNEDSLDFSRMMRLEEFPEFVSFDGPDTLAPFLENDLLVAMTKYSDSIEHRIDLSNEFGAANHGFHDYMAIQADPMHGRKTIATLLSSNKILKQTHSRMGGSGEGMLSKVFDSRYFMAPIKDEFVAGAAADDLIKKASSGASVAELEADIMGLLDQNMTNTPEAAQMRSNFSKRAKAIANALVDTKGLTVATSQKNVKHAQGFMNAAMRKPIEGYHGLYSLKGASKWLRGVNAVTLLSFTTLTSLADLALPLIRTGDLKSYYTALKQYAREPAYRDMIRNVGAATENAVHQRLTVAHGVDSTQFMTGFFNATLLTPWTDAMRNVAAAVSYEHIKAQHRILREAPSTRKGRIARKILQQEGLSGLIADQNVDLDFVMESRGTQKEHPLNDRLATSIINLTNQMIFTPNPNDLPLWGQTPLGAIALQLKSYPLMMQRLTNTVVSEAFAGNSPTDRAANFTKALVGQSDNRLGPLGALLIAGPAAGAGTTMLKDIVQGRGGEENRDFALRERKLSKTLTTAFEDNPDLDRQLGLYFDGMVALGGMGFVGELFYDVAQSSDNGVYGSMRLAETLGGPTVGLYNDAVTVLQGGRSLVDGDEANGQQRAAAREIVGRVPVLGGVSWAKELAVDSIAGVRGKAGRPSSSSSFGGSFGGGSFGGSY